MDKFEYRIKTEQMLSYVEAKSYKKAMEISDSIDWRKVKNATMLCTVSEIYEHNGEFQKSRDILFIAFDKSPGSKKIVYRLAALALKMDDIDEATDCYEEFVKLAPKDPNQFILRYKILRAQNGPLEQQIEALRAFKKAEYVEKWAYELAKLYNEAGMTAECLEECDDLILWFSEGKYVFRAMDLKKRYKPLTALQQEKYNQFKERDQTKPLLTPADLPKTEVKTEAVADKTEAAEAKASQEIKAEVKAPKPVAEDITKVLPVSDVLKQAKSDVKEVTPIGEEMPEEENSEKPTEEQSPYVTGQLKIEEILREWEAKQKVNAGKIEELRQQKEEQPAQPKQPVQPAPEPIKETPPEPPVKQTTAPLSDEIRDLMEDLKDGTEDNAYTEEEPEEDDYVGEQPEEEVENMGNVVEGLHIDDDDEEEDLDEYEDDDYEEDSEEYEDGDDYEEEPEDYEDGDDYEEDTDEYDDDDDLDEYEEDLEEYEDDDDLDEYEEDLEEYEDDDDLDDYEEDLEEYEDGDDYEEDLEEYEDGDEEDLEEYEDDDEYEEDLEEYEDDDEVEAEEYDDDDYEEDLEEYEDDNDYKVEAEEYEEGDDYEEDTEVKPKKKKQEPLDLDKSLDIEEPSEAEITARLNRSKGGVTFDTGFVVQGRYDLSATSEIGLKVGLTEEQKKLFSYFVPIRGVSEQIVTVLENDKRGKRRHGTSRNGNITVIGRKGTGKTVLAVDLVKAIQKEREIKQGRVAIITGEALNKKELDGIFKKLYGGALIIEKAGKLNTRTIKELDSLMEDQTGEMLVILEEQRKPLEKIFAANPRFKKKFTSKIELPVFINDELVTFGQTYAKENGYRIDDMGILALYSRIDVMQREDHAVTVTEVKEIMDEAIEHSQKANVKHLVKRVFGKSTDESERIILKEDDFKR
ncbi:MAG: hypothetical protein ACRC3H_10465 [Lachnospiraceae bacterium]